MRFIFDKETLSDFENSRLKEWALTNGLGGYAGSSVIGAHNRTHQGYLIASLHPPVERYLVFSKTNESFSQNGSSYNLEASQHLSSDGTVTYKKGNEYLTEFCYDGNVHFTYQAGDLLIHKHIAMIQGKNQVIVGYEIKNSGTEATFTITPLMNFREHSASSTRETFKFTEIPSAQLPASTCGFALSPAEKPDLFLWLGSSGGSLQKRAGEALYDINMQLQTEVINETDGLDCHYTPYDICLDIPADSTGRFALICQVGELQKDAFEEIDANKAFHLIEEQKKYLDALVAQAGYPEDSFANALVLAANQFLAHRESTGLKTILAGLPWFTDWGRDTMIAYTGLTLSTKRFTEAKEILQTFAQYISHGMVPNMFPDDGLAPLYNTVDASLWYFYAVYQYLHYVNTPEAYTFIREEIYPGLKEIIQAYKQGTDFSIYMEPDGLIHAGSGLDQVTWMDVRVGDWVATPRHGKPVEINALWYNALCVMAELSNTFGEDPTPYEDLAQTVKKSFCEKFWYTQGNYLYDVISEEEKDASLRPNQIYAVSLPYTMLDAEKSKAVVDTVREQLYAKRGIRSLAPNHPDYHPIYCGSLPKRDAAYHQGTAWGFLMGGFITAYLKVYGHDEAALLQAMEFLSPVKEHLYDGCIGSISEIFDGDAPHTARGCYAQAWSVGEVLRCYTEDILPYLNK